MTATKTDDPTLPKGWVRECIDKILLDCGYSSYNELADTLGESRANMNNWMQRDTYGRNGVPRLYDLTGANTSWLLARSEEAFPEGVKVNPALKTARVYGSITEIRKQILEFARALAETETTRVLAQAWKEKLESSESPEYQEKASRGLLLSLLESSLGSSASSRKSAQAEPVPAKRGQGKRK